MRGWYGYHVERLEAIAAHAHVKSLVGFWNIRTSFHPAASNLCSLSCHIPATSFACVMFPMCVTSIKWDSARQHGWFVLHLWPSHWEKKCPKLTSLICIGRNLWQLFLQYPHGKHVGKQLLIYTSSRHGATLAFVCSFCPILTLLPVFIS